MQPEIVLLLVPSVIVAAVCWAFCENRKHTQEIRKEEDRQQAAASLSPRLQQDEHLREVFLRRNDPPLTPVMPWVPPTEEEKRKFREANGYIYRPQHDSTTGVEAVPDRLAVRKTVNHRDSNGFGLRKTPSGRYKKTRNTYISDDLEYVLLEPQERVTFSYTSMKGNQRDHAIQVKCITGSKDAQATHMVGIADDGMKLSFFLDKMQHVQSHLTERQHADGVVWLKEITNT